MSVASIARLRAAVLAILSLLAGGAFAHEGHDHAEDKKPVARTTLAPRLEALGPFELVAVHHAGELLIYLDRFATNEPIAGAEVTVETPDGPRQAVLKDGVYRLAAPRDRGSVDLIFTVVEGSSVKVLSGTLRLDATASAPEQDFHERRLWSSALAQEMAQGLKERVSTGGTWLLLLLTFIAGAVVSRLLVRRPKLALALLALAPLLALVCTAAFAHEGERSTSRRRWLLQSRATWRSGCRMARCSYPSPCSGSSPSAPW